MSALDRLTTQLGKQYAVFADKDTTATIVLTDDLAWVLAVVGAAQTYVDECAGLGDAARVIRTFDALAAAIAATEGDKP